MNNLTVKQEFIESVAKLGGKVTKHGNNLTVLWPGEPGKRKCCEIAGLRCEGDFRLNSATKKYIYESILDDMKNPPQINKDQD